MEKIAEEFAKDFLKAQQEMESKLDFDQGFGYRYAPLPEVVRVIKEAFKKNNLCFTQDVSSKRLPNDRLVCIVKTLIIHRSGEMLKYECEVPAPNMKSCNEAQCVGAGITYARRYALAAAVGLAAEEDTDAASDVSEKETRSTLRNSLLFDMSNKKSYDKNDMKAIRNLEHIKEGMSYDDIDEDFLREKYLPFLQKDIKNCKSEKQKRLFYLHINYLKKRLKVE